MSEGVSEVSEPVSTAKHASKVSSVEQANEQTDERVAQYSNLYSLLFWPVVQQSC